MEKERVVAVDGVVEHQLPVRFVPRFDTARVHQHPPRGREVAEVVEVLCGASQMLGEADAGRAEGAENEAPVGVDSGHPRHREIGLVELWTVARRVRGADQRTRACERPAVIRAPESGGVAALELAHGIAAVRAPVQQNVGGPLGVAGQDHRLEADDPRHVIPGLGDL